MEAVKAAVEQYKKGSPSTFGGPTSAPKAPATANIWIIPCDAALSGCNTPATYAAKAAKALGWKVTQFNGKSDPATENTGLLNAVAAKADAIITVSVDSAVVQGGLKAAKEAGIPVISVSNGTGTPNPAPTKKPDFDYSVDVSVDYPAIGKMMADAVIADSDGKANVLLMGDKEFPSVVTTQVGIEKELAKCTTCTVSDPVYFTSSALASSLGQQTVGLLQKNPDIDYIISPYDPAAAVQVQAIQAAGLADRVKIVSVVAAPQNLNYIKNGQVQFADAGEGNNYLGYAAIDQTIRLISGQPVYEPNGENTPIVLLEKDNLPPSGQEWTPAFDFESAYMKLWKG